MFVKQSPRSCLNQLIQFCCWLISVIPKTDWVHLCLPRCTGRLVVAHRILKMLLNSKRLSRQYTNSSICNWCSPVTIAQMVVRWWQLQRCALPVTVVQRCYFLRVKTVRQVHSLVKRSVWCCKCHVLMLIELNLYSINMVFHTCYRRLVLSLMT